MIAGDPDPVFTITYTGFKFGETASVIDTPPTAFVLVPHTLATTYQITVSGGLDNNYDFSYVSGTLNVVPAPIAKLVVSASPSTLTTSQTSTITVTGKDQYENDTLNQSGTVVIVSADNGGALGATILTLTNGIANTTLNKISAGVVNVTASSGSLTPGTIQVTFTSSDPDAPTVLSQTPMDNSIDVAINISPTITFSEAMDAATLNSGTIQLRTYSGDIPVAASILYNSSIFVVTITPNTNLNYSTQYYLYVSGAKDVVGNTVTAYITKANQEFTTQTELIPAGIDYEVIPDSSNFRAQPTDSYLGGWHYTFKVTVNNMDETNLSVKFADWVNTADGAMTVPALGNIRLLINSETGGPLSGVGITDNIIQNGLDPVKSYSIGNNYSDQTPGPIDISGIDADLVKPGRQVQFDVFTKLPIGTVAGFYTTTFGIQSLVPADGGGGGGGGSTDTTPPTIDSFTIPATSDSLTVSISSFTAHDNVDVTGYLLTETPDVPAADNPNWSVTTPTQYIFSSDGAKTLYAWAKDAAGNISSSLNGSVMIILPPAPDTTSPEILSSYPVDDSIDVPVDIQPTLTFSEALNPSTVNGGNIQLRVYAEVADDATIVPSALSLSAGDTIVTITPSSPLEHSKQYYFYVDAGVKDMANISIISANRWLHSDRAEHEFTTVVVTP